MKDQKTIGLDENFDEKNLESLMTLDIPDKTYRPVEASYGATDVHPSVESMKKTVKMLLD